MSENMNRQGLTTRIGMISPDDGVNDDEYYNYLPPGVTLLWNRYRTPRRNDPISVEMVGSYGDLRVVEEAAKTLRITRPEVVVFCCNSCGFVHGQAGDQRICQAVAKAAQSQAVSITASQLKAIEALGVSRLAVAAPYPVEVTALLVALLQQAGYAVVQERSLGLETEWQIGNSDPRVWQDLAISVDHPGAECVLLACGGIRTAPILDALERDLGKPVVSAPAATMWHALRTAGVSEPVHGYGVLLERH